VYGHHWGCGMANDELQVEHVIQPAILCRDIDRTMDFLHTLLGIFPSERVDIKNTGVNNAVYAFGGMTFLELIEPYDPGCAAMRLLERFGEGWHMLTVDLVPAPPEAIERRLAEANVRVVRHNRTPHVQGIWHLHPRDTGGVLLAMAVRADRDDNRAWAGPAWREYVRTNTRVVQSVAGVSIATDDLDATAARYTRLGFRFDRRWRDAADTVLEAVTPRGTVLQLRSPTGGSAPSAAHARSRGSGLFHLILTTNDLNAAAAATERAGATIERKTQESGQTAFWTAPETTMGIPIEFRQAQE